MTPKDFRRIALGMKGAYEASHMNHPDFRAPNGKIFATLNEPHTRGMASLTPEQQEHFVERAPDVFIPASGAWGRGGSTMIELADADEELVGEAVTLAFQRVNASPKKSSPTRSTGSRPTPAPSSPSRGTGASPPRRARNRRP
jgi:hypothetical protein